MVDYLEGIDYNFVEVNNTTGFKILTGEFAGVIYTYEDISISDAPGIDQAILSFNFTIVDPVDHINENFFDLEFKTVIGDILMAVLIKNNAENDIESEQTYIEESSL
jgi:hypothetical protein